MSEHRSIEQRPLGPRPLGHRPIDHGIEHARAWFARRTFAAASAPDAVALAAAIRAQELTVGVVIPARDEAHTIGPIVGCIATELLGAIVHDLVVVDHSSTDRTAEIASSAGARVVDVSRVLPEIPWVFGKGEALWRGLASIDTDLVCFVDADIRNFDARFVTRLIAPLVACPDVAFVKGFYRRPLRVDSAPTSGAAGHGAAADVVVVPAAGGRVTELTARPLLNLCYPELTGFLQPLAGEYAGRRDVLERLGFQTGWGVDVALLIDLMREVGLDAMAQADLDERVHRNRPLRELRSMATAITRTIVERAERDGRLSMPGVIERPVLLPAADGTLEVSELADEERPPIAELDVRAAAAGDA